MPNNSRIIKRIALFALLFCPALIYIGLTQGRHNILVLPIYGPREAVKSVTNGKERIDTLYHTVAPFEFTAQDGKPVTEKDVAGKITVVEYFFARCQGICPRMRTQLRKVYAQTAEMGDVLILSHTVDPEHDSQEALKEYAEAAGVNDRRWLFLTGSREDLYRQARKSYFLGVEEGNEAAGEETFLHSDQLVLVDKKKRIRGYYTGTEPEEIKRLIDEIKVLKAEELIPRKSDPS